MKPTYHLVASAVMAAGLWIYTKSFLVGALCIASGVLLDFDHVIEYIIHYGWKGLSIRNVAYRSEETEKPGGKGFKKLYLVFHSAELLIIFWIATIYTGNMYILAVSIGYTMHIIMDRVGNRPYTYSYFVIWRLLQNFHTDKLLRKRGRFT